MPPAAAEGAEISLLGVASGGTTARRKSLSLGGLIDAGAMRLAAGGGDTNEIYFCAGTLLWRGAPLRRLADKSAAGRR
jgi:hypothetical protein